MNEKHFYAQRGEAVKSKQAYGEIKELTDIYNEEIAGGKWNGIMNMSPRSRPVFGKPDINSKNSKSDSSGRMLEPIKTISVSELTFDSTKLHLIPGLGVEGVSLTWIKFNNPGYSEDKAESTPPSASIKLELPEGRRIIELICVPTHAVHEGHALRTAICLGDNSPGIVDVKYLQARKNGAKMLSGVIHRQKLNSFLKRRVWWS